MVEEVVESAVGEQKCREGRRGQRCRVSSAPPAGRKRGDQYEFYKKKSYEFRIWNYGGNSEFIGLAWKHVGIGIAGPQTHSKQLVPLPRLQHKCSSNGNSILIIHIYSSEM